MVTAYTVRGLFTFFGIKIRVLSVRFSDVWDRTLFYVKMDVCKHT